MAEPVPVVSSVVFDCADAHLVSRFWMGLLDTEVAAEFAGFIWLKPQSGGSLQLAFQEVPDPTPGKNKLHLDAHHEDLETVTERVGGLGGALVGTHNGPGFVWNVYADPEGNQFCVGHEVEPG